MKRRHAYWACMTLIWIGFYAAANPEEAHGQEACSEIDIIEPRQIQIDNFFQGQDITVKAIIPSHSHLVVRIVRPREDLKLMKKGRVGGIWMNVEQVTFLKVPKVYLLWTSKDFSAANGGQDLRKLKLDYLSQLSECLPGEPLKAKDSLMNELIKLKTYDNLYNICEGTIQSKPLEKGPGDQAKGVLHVPAKIYPGMYTMELYAFQDGKGTLLRSHPLRVKLSGFPAILSDLATQRGLLYGVLAAVIATISGSLVGIVFGGKGSH